MKEALNILAESISVVIRGFSSFWNLFLRLLSSRWFWGAIGAMGFVVPICLHFKEEKEKLKEVEPLKIDKLLCKDKIKSPKLFRVSGPLWTDFKKGYVFERKEVNEIINKLNKEGLIILTGEPASGKSIILRNIGYKLARRRKRVYYVDLKSNKPKADTLNKIKKGYILIDDAHLDLKFTDRVIDLYTKNLKIVMATRPIKQVNQEKKATFSYKLQEYLKDGNKKVQISPHSAVDGIIRIFSEKIKPFPESLIDKLNRDNLWILAWQLETYEKYNSIDYDKIYKKIQTYLREDLKDLYGVNSAEDIFLPLSLFYRYEIPVRKKFIVDLVGESENIEKLVESKEIIELERDGYKYLGLYHSELANIYFKAFKNIEGLGYQIKGKLENTSVNGYDEKPSTDEYKWFYNCLRLYIEKFPDETPDIIYNLGHKLYWMVKIYLSQRHKESVKDTFKKFFPESILYKHINQFLKGLYRIEDIFKITEILEYIDLLADQNLFKKIVRGLDLDKIAEKINKDERIDAILKINRILSKCDQKLCNNLLMKIDLDRLKTKIKDVKEEDLDKIGKCLYGISLAEKELAISLSEDLSNEIDNKINKLTPKSGWYGLEIITDFITHIALIDEDYASKYDELLINTINNEKDIKSLSLAFHFFLKKVPKYTNKILNKIGLEKIKEKIQHEDEIHKIELLIEGLSKVNTNFTKKLIDETLDIIKDNWKNKKYEDVENMNTFLYLLKRIYPEKEKEFKLFLIKEVS